MPLPTLQQFQAPMVQPATMKLQAMKMGDEFNRTQIAQGNLEENKKYNDAIIMFKGYDLAAKTARNEEEFRQIFKEATGRETNVKFSQGNVEGLRCAWG